MAALGAHPRIAHMLLAAGDLGGTALACDLAAVLSERDLLRGPGAAADADIGLRVDLLHGQARQPPDGTADRGAIARARKLARGWRRALRAADRPTPRHMAGVLLALAYPDRIGAARGDGRFLLSGGRGAMFRETQPLSRQAYLAVAELDAGEREARIFLAASLSRADIDVHLGHLLSQRDVIRWDAGQQAVIARRERRLGAILLDEARLEAPDPSQVTGAMLDGVRQLGLAALPWTRAASALRGGAGRASI